MGYHISHLCNWDLKLNQLYYIFITEVTAKVKLILFLTRQKQLEIKILTLCPIKMTSHSPLPLLITCQYTKMSWLIMHHISLDLEMDQEEAENTDGEKFYVTPDEWQKMKQL